MEEIKDHLKKVFAEYTGQAYYGRLITAKNVYFELTGSINEDEDDYEAKMNCFNDWYIFEYIAENRSGPFILDYIENNGLSGDVSEALTTVNYSLFEFTGENLKKQFVINDLFHGKKYPLFLGHHRFGLVKGDLFLGRILKFRNENLLLHGVSILPKEAKSALVKEAKKVKKFGSLDLKREFLVKVEQLKTKWRRYGHVAPARIFVF